MHERQAFDLILGRSKEAFDLVVRARKAPGAAGWADQQLRSLADAGAFVTSRGQLLTNWAYVRRVLGDDLFMKHVRGALDRCCRTIPNE